MTPQVAAVGAEPAFDAHASLEAGLAIAAHGIGTSFVVVPAPVAAATALVRAWPDRPIVAWSSEMRVDALDDAAGDDARRVVRDATTLVGIDVARELCGAGEARWREVVGAAGDIVVGSAMIDGAEVPVSALGLARPRFLGGGAFTPGAAARGPWLPFGDARFVLPRWLYASDGARACLVLAIDAREAADARWRDELAAHLRALADKPPARARREAALSGRAQEPIDRAQPSVIALDRGDDDAWRRQIRAITAAITAGRCSKIVAARAIEARFAGPPRVADLLTSLDERHADCVRLLVRPDTHTALVAATPERLVRRSGTAIACDPLAGSARVPPDDVAAASAALLASAKDRNEHQLVVAAIARALDDIAIGDIPATPNVRVLRHVLHLHTPIRATLRWPRHVLELVERLHPTPAVGGTPTDVAVDWIAHNEPVARGWYAAPVGWFDLDGNGELAIALRCGVLAGDRAHLWAGAGIVAGSDPDRELAETELKLRAMLGALGITA
jgi:menaquinone-specific isochorismate synthase